MDPRPRGSDGRSPAARASKGGPVSGEEWVAGFADGLRAGRIAFLNQVRRELGPLGFAVDALGQVTECKTPEIPDVPIPEQVNPTRSRDYSTGWQAGLRASPQRTAEHVRLQMVPRGIHVAPDGAAASIEAATLLAQFQRYLQEQGEQRGLFDELLDEVVKTAQKIDETVLPLRAEGNRRRVGG